MIWISSSWKHNLGAVLALSSLAGCVAYHARPLAPERSAAAFAARSLEDPRLLALIASNRSAHAAANEWNLSTLTIAALYFNPDLDVVRARWHASRSAVLTAAQIPNPSLQLSIGYATNPSNGDSPITAGAGFDIPVQTAGKRGYRVAAAEEMSNAARLDIRDTAWKVRILLRSRLLDWQAAQARTVLLEKQLDTQASIAAMLDKRLALGAASLPEDNEARIALARDRAQLAKARRQREDAKAQTAAAIGLPVAALDSIAVNFEVFEREGGDLDPAVLRRAALLGRADLGAALARYGAGEAMLQTQVAKQYPDIHVGPGYTFDMGTNKFALGVSGLTLPAFNHNEGPIAEALAHRAELATRFEAAQARVIEEVDEAIRDCGAARRELKLADAQVALQRAQWTSALRSFAMGETDRLELDLAERTLRTAELDRAGDRMRLQQVLGRLEGAVQHVPFPVDVDPETDPRGERQ